jgi:hypothetical protein
VCSNLTSGVFLRTLDKAAFLRVVTWRSTSWSLEKVAMTMQCEECGKATEAEYRFCPWCGELLDDIKALVDAQAEHRPPVLYHYTSAEAAAKIIEGGTLWATEIGHLNDTSEFLYGIAAAEDLIAERQRHDEESTAVKGVAEARIDFLDLVLNELSDTERPQVFVSSFSSLEDSRSQWGLYCRGLGGIAVGFDHEKLRRLIPQGYPYPSAPPDRIRQTPFQVNPCVYRERTQRKLIARQLNKALEGIEAAGGFRPPDGASTSDVAGVVRVCSAYAAILKHPAFADEREWRLIAGKPRNPLVRSYIRGGSPVFYLELDLARASDAFPITEIVVGPQADQEVAANRWQSWLDQRGLKTIDVKLSDVPLRGV